jgi:hypothetical protein
MNGLSLRCEKSQNEEALHEGREVTGRKLDLTTLIDLAWLRLNSPILSRASPLSRPVNFDKET